MTMNKPKKHGAQAAAAAPDPAHPDQFPGSSFAPNAPDGAPSKVAGFVTEPDARGLSRRTATEAYYADTTLFPKGPPADACRKFGTVSATKLFPLSQAQIDSINVNCGAVNFMLGGISTNAIPSSFAGLGHTAESNWQKIIPDGRFLRGTGEDGTPAADVDEALVASWKTQSTPGKPFYYRTPFFDAIQPPSQIGGGL